MSDNRVILSKNDARRLYWDIWTSNLLYIAIMLYIIAQAPLWVSISAGVFIWYTILHTFQAKKVLVKGKYFKRKVKKDDGSKGT